MKAPKLRFCSSIAATTTLRRTLPAASVPIQPGGLTGVTSVSVALSSMTMMYSPGETLANWYRPVLAFTATACVAGPAGVAAGTSLAYSASPVPASPASRCRLWLASLYT